MEIQTKKETNKSFFRLIKNIIIRHLTLFYVTERGVMIVYSRRFGKTNRRKEAKRRDTKSNLPKPEGNVSSPVFSECCLLCFDLPFPVGALRNGTFRFSGAVFFSVSVQYRLLDAACPRSEQNRISEKTHSGTDRRLSVLPALSASQYHRCFRHGVPKVENLF